MSASGSSTSRRCSRAKAIDATYLTVTPSFPIHVPNATSNASGTRILPIRINTARRLAPIYSFASSRNTRLPKIPQLPSRRKPASAVGRLSDHVVHHELLDASQWVMALAPEYLQHVWMSMAKLEMVASNCSYNPESFFLSCAVQST